MAKDFRFLLRDDTQQKHDHLDQLFSSLDVSTYDGLISFLRVHLGCFQTMHDAAEAGSRSRHRLADMVLRIKQDLTMLGQPVDIPNESLPQVIAPLATDYIVEGSRLGSQVLKRRWAQSGDRRVRQADNYFSMETESDRWRMVCDALAAVPAGSAEARRITHDTQVLFSMFLNVTHTHMKTVQRAKEPAQ